MTHHVLLTGASGFVGRQVLRALEKHNLRISLVIRIGSRQQFSECTSVESILETPDLFSESVEWWADACNGIDTIIHVAWYAEPHLYIQSPKNLDCLIGTLQMAQGANLARVRRYIGIGTCFEYDLSSGVVSVKTPLKPTTSYAGAKAASFMALSQWLPKEGIEFAWCRLFYLYGDSEDSRRFVSYLRAKLASGEPVKLTNGNKIRDFLDVSEAGRMIVDVALSDQIGPVNICSGIPVTIRQLAEKIADEYGRRDLLKFGARPDNHFDPPCVVGIR
jgi:dTDP-6-deoxy-L-talose 4-dehydrogenase (NAD+)